MGTRREIKELIRDLYKKLKPKPLSKMKKGELIQYAHVFRTAYDHLQSLEMPETRKGRPDPRPFDLDEVVVDTFKISVPKPIARPLPPVKSIIFPGAPPYTPIAEILGEKSPV